MWSAFERGVHKLAAEMASHGAGKRRIHYSGVWTIISCISSKEVALAVGGACGGDAELDESMV